ncbi:sensor histidine kinase [Sporomusa acidovorans]|uniref:histidine kinase n=1 Tax=Sporomusa acidovorans (strain ATCC 49682 / DSM 3132 / Mol) TaxID=1123286 RepID=A0ABZ3JB13_SPOA4|nr:ATP-binding protein [Sporomusa acidovorans]OZC22905.1 sensor histidine kinase GlnK [Sporomusa acidovorans DSM 3132]SDE95576.1 two-component system, sensor histidine kinase YcbA [Sporomusa acidovorans]
MIPHVILLVSITGLIFTYPFDDYFRFTLGVVVLATLLLYFQRLPALRIAVLSGALTLLLRTTLKYPFVDESLLSAFMHNLPAFGYYLGYGLLFRLLKVRNYTGNIPALILLLSLCDIASNCVELIIRREVVGRTLETIFTEIVAVGVGRSLLTVIGYYSLKRYRDFVLAEDHAARYAELIFIIAKLKAELFYLKKSSNDIELVMEKGYTLYQSLNAAYPGELAKADSPAARALAIARDIHEVKKDYYRVTRGIEEILDIAVCEEGLPLSEFFQIVEQNTRRYINGLDKPVTITFDYRGELVTDQYYAIVSILNNLITNAVEAIQAAGVIAVTGQWNSGRLVLVVADNGPGIPPAETELIFAPGYSTKFSEVTGQMSTGLGLSHVKHLTESLGGQIIVTSKPGKTIFTVSLPLTNLRKME